MLDNKWDVVSLRLAHPQQQRDKEQLEWLEGYDQVVVCFDSDKAGQTAIDEIKDIFSPSNSKSVSCL